MIALEGILIPFCIYLNLLNFIRFKAFLEMFPSQAFSTHKRSALMTTHLDSWLHTTLSYSACPVCTPFRMCFFTFYVQIFLKLWRMLPSNWNCVQCCALVNCCESNCYCESVIWPYDSDFRFFLYPCVMLWFNWFTNAVMVQNNSCRFISIFLCLIIFVSYLRFSLCMIKTTSDTAGMW